MILVDLSQLAISNLMVSPNLRKGEVDDLLIKHMILNSIRAYNNKFRSQYGQIVLCCDSKSNWRKKEFKHYKANRKESKKNSNFDWDEVFETIRTFKEELREFFPYKVIEVDDAEGDDVVATLAMNANEPVLIVGSDKDYVQLLGDPNIKQYSIIKKEFVTVDNPDFFLFEHIIRGDKSDGVPNVKSSDDVFVTSGTRQTPIKEKDIIEWYGKDPEVFCENEEMKKRFDMNQKLIDFDSIPSYITKNVLEEYKKEPTGNHHKIMEYFAANRMRQLISYINDF